MLKRCSKDFRLKAASLLVALYAICLVAPFAALAFGDFKAAHCLTDESHGLAATHVHSDGATHPDSGDGDDGSGPAGKCCGLFCLSALAPSAEQPAAQLEPMALILSLNTTGIIAAGPDRLYRPPDSLLSL